MFIASYQPTTPSRRRTSSLTFWYLQFSVARRLSVGFQRSIGRSVSGRRIALSKGAVKIRRVFRRIADTFAGLFITSLVYEYQRDSRRSGALALMCNAVGCWFYMPQTMNMLRLGYFRVWSPRTPMAFAMWQWPRRLKHYSLYTQVSSLRILAGAPVKFIRACGSVGTLLSPRFYKKWAVIALPSGAVRLFSNNDFAHRGPIGPMGGEQLGSSKAGHAVNAGRSPRVRGTVKNANDHPNGGRSRSLECSRTPWGYVTKRSRPPRKRTKLKPLSRRHV